jgi:hypothetical protein
MTTLIMVAAILALVIAGATVISRVVALLVAVVPFPFPLPIAFAPIFVRLMAVA